MTVVHRASWAITTSVSMFEELWDESLVSNPNPTFLALALCWALNKLRRTENQWQASKYVRGSVRNAAIVAIGSLLGACSVIQVVQKDGAVKVERSFGMVSIQVCPKNEGLVTSLTSFGIASTPLGITIGFARETLALLPETCKVAMWIDDERPLGRLEALVGPLKEVCIVNSPQEGVSK